MNNLQLLTIIAEDALGGFIAKEIIAMGARGYTESSVAGKGMHDVRDNQWEGENIKIETIVSEESCRKILDHLQQKYFDRYAMIAFYHPVNVVRTHHFL